MPTSNGKITTGGIGGLILGGIVLGLLGLVAFEWLGGRIVSMVGDVLLMLIRALKRA